MRPGALLGVPAAAAAALAPSLRTAPGRTILTALAPYGGYVVDDTAGDSAAICAEPAAVEELLVSGVVEVCVCGGCVCVSSL